MQIAFSRVDTIKTDFDKVDFDGVNAVLQTL